MDYYGKKVNGEAVFAPAVAEQRRRQWAKVKEGGQFKVSLTVPRPGKTKNQLGNIWGNMMARAVLELDEKAMDTSYIFKVDNPTGTAISKDLLCEYLYNVCPIFEGGKRITLSQMDTDQANKFFDDSRAWLASQFGIDIPDPNPDWNK